MRYLVLLMLAGCAGAPIDMSRRPPSDWPTLEIVPIKTSSDEVKRRCYAADLLIAYGCTVPNFFSGKCLIYLATDDPATLSHERLHCLGYDHPGESTMRDLWERWKRVRG